MDEWIFGKAENEENICRRPAVAEKKKYLPSILSGLFDQSSDQFYGKKSLLTEDP